MEVFRRYYCPYKTDSFVQIIGHCSVLHEETLLKYRKLVLDDLTGICRYQTQTYEGVVPLKIKESGKSIALWDLNLNFQQFYLFQYRRTSVCQTCLSRKHHLCRSDRPFPNFSPIFYCISTLFVTNSLMTKTRLYRSDFSFP